MMKPLQSRLIIMALILQACFAIPLNSAASPISRQQAQQNALNFLQERGKTVAVATLRHAPMLNSMTDEPQPYYVFNIGNNQGYVIASGDDAAYPVLGYSDEGFIDVNNIPCNLQAWLDCYAQQIKHLQEHGATPSHTPKKTDYPPIEPMLTCHWNQGYPYNMYCPIDPTTGKQCVTGCVATAMAQVMYYHRARSIKQTTIEIPEYTTRTRGIHVDAIPAGTIIDWDNMVDHPNSYNTTEVQKQAVASLMKYCGTAIRMDYTSSGSGSAVQPFHLVRYFNYSPLTTKINRYSQDVTDEEWENLIYSEIKNSRPVLYSISDGQAFHHDVVCDGYDGNGYYHINFGWGGSNDGFYLITRADGSMTMDLGDDFVGSWVAIFNAEPLPTPPNDDQGNGIHFIDPNTRAICLWIADANGDWVLTENEAAAVTDASKFCFTNTPIITFDEFKYFTGITSIDGNTFRGCSNLKSITLPNIVTAIGDGAFEDCMELTSINVPNSVTIIGNDAFRGCYGLASINIPSTVTTIGNYAFGFCRGLTSIIIPNSVKTIGNYAFYDCNNLKDLTWNAKYCESFNLPSTIENLTFGDEVEMIPDHFASGCSGLTSVTIPSSVTTIGSSAFYGCSGLTGVTIPSSVTTIGSSAFSGCIGLTGVTIPNSVTTIDNYAFMSCSGLTSIEIPNSIESMGEYVFYNCTSLTDVTVNGGTIGSFAFSRCTNLTNLTINGNFIGSDAFSRCTSLKKLTIGKSVTYISGQSGLWDCSGLTDLIWNAQNCTYSGSLCTTNIERVTIGNEVKVLPDNFVYRSKITSVTIPNSVTNIGRLAFGDCSNLKSIAFGKSVTNIEPWNLSGCDNLTTLYCLSLNPPSLNRWQFDSDWETNIQKFKSVTLYVPMDAVDAYKSTEPWCYFGNIIGLDPSLGDVNIDNEINIADINVIINSILSDNDNCLNEFMSDVNRDGEVNIADVNSLIDKILSHH